MRRELEANEKHRRFLQGVVDHGDSSAEYHEIADVLNRCGHNCRARPLFFSRPALALS